MRIATLLIALALSLLTVACSPHQAVTTTQAGNALLDLQDRYSEAREALLADIDRLPVETGVALLDLDSEVGAYVTELSRLWRTADASQLADLERIYLRGQRLYDRAETLLIPHLDLLDPDTRYALSGFSTNAERVQAAYDAYSSDPNLQRRMDLARAGIEFATLAVKLGLMVL